MWLKGALPYSRSSKYLFGCLFGVISVVVPPWSRSSRLRLMCCSCAKQTIQQVCRDGLSTYQLVSKRRQNQSSNQIKIRERPTAVAALLYCMCQCYAPRSVTLSLPLTPHPVHNLDQKLLNPLLSPIQRIQPSFPLQTSQRRLLLFRLLRRFRLPEHVRPLIQTLHHHIAFSARLGHPLYSYPR
jgi:hypothetical protein